MIQVYDIYCAFYFYYYCCYLLISFLHEVLRAAYLSNDGPVKCPMIGMHYFLMLYHHYYNFTEKNLMVKKIFTSL